MSVFCHNIGSGTGTFEKEGIAVIEEIHPLIAQPVDGSDMTPQGGLDGLFESIRFLCHHPLRLFEAISNRIITSRPRIME